MNKLQAAPGNARKLMWSGDAGAMVGDSHLSHAHTALQEAQIALNAAEQRGRGHPVGTSPVECCDALCLQCPALGH